MENVPINVIQAQLGHSNAATTSRYLQHIAPQQLITTIRNRSWKAG
jgi:integrase